MTDVSPTQRARRRQFVIAGAVVAGFVGVSGIGVLMTGSGDSDQPKAADIHRRSYIAPGESVAPEDAWRGVSDSRLNSIEHQLKVLEKDSRAPTPAPKTPAREEPALSATDLDARLRDYERNVATQYPPGRPSDPLPATAGKPAPPLAASAGATASAPAVAPPQHAATPGEGAPPAVGRSIVTVRLRGPDPGMQAAAIDTRSDAAGKQAVRRTTDTYLPAGMFGQARLLSGLDAPTGGQAQANPQPVLLRLTDLAVLPNRYRYNWQQCHVIGAGYGELSSERAFIRTETLSCVGSDGSVLDVPIKGYIAGEDGKAGIRGRLVSKQGQVIGNALLAGVVSGIGGGMERAANLQSVSPLGTTSTVRPGDEFKAAIGTGAGQSLDRLANYYIALAEKMFPVIEVDADRTVDIILTEGVSTDVQLNH